MELQRIFFLNQYYKMTTNQPNLGVTFLAMKLMTLIILVILIDLTLQMAGEAQGVVQMGVVLQMAAALEIMADLMVMDVQSEVIILAMIIHFLT